MQYHENSTQQEIADSVSKKPVKNWKLGATRLIVFSATLIAISLSVKILCNNLTFFGLTRISFVYIPYYIAGIFLGPIFGFFVGAGADVISFFVVPTGPFNPLNMITNGLYGFTMGLFVRYLKFGKLHFRITVVGVFCAAAITLLWGSFTWVMVYVEEVSWGAFASTMATRAPQAALVAAQGAIIPVIVRHLNRTVFHDRPVT